MPTYTKADADTRDFVHATLKELRPDLAEVDVRVDVLMARPTVDKHTGEPKGPALKLHGVPALAIVRITTTKDRVAGLADAIVYIDHDRWEDMPEVRRTALVHHELEHLQLACEADGTPKTDDACRPKLKMKPHDWDLGGFASTVERFKGDAHESQHFLDLNKRMTQLCFPWNRDAA